MAKRILNAPDYVTNTIQSLANVVKGQASALKTAFDKIATDAKAYDTYLHTEMQADTGAYAVGFDGSSDNLGDAMTTAESNISTLQTEMNAVESAVSTAEDSITALESDMASAQSAISALQSVALTKVEGTTTIPTTGWVAHTGDNALKLDLPITGILSTDNINMEVDEDQQDVATASGINPTVNEYNGGVTLYAETAPSQDISVKWWVIR